MLNTVFKNTPTFYALSKGPRPNKSHVFSSFVITQYAQRHKHLTSVCLIIRYIYSLREHTVLYVLKMFVTVSTTFLRTDGNEPMHTLPSNVRTDRQTAGEIRTQESNKEGILHEK
jgi:hypothetical protein